MFATQGIIVWIQQCHVKTLHTAVGCCTQSVRQCVGDVELILLLFFHHIWSISTIQTRWWNKLSYCYNKLKNVPCHILKMWTRFTSFNTGDISVEVGWFSWWHSTSEICHSSKMKTSEQSSVLEMSSDWGGCSAGIYWSGEVQNSHHLFHQVFFFFFFSLQPPSTELSRSQQRRKWSLIVSLMEIQAANTSIL